MQRSIHMRRELCSIWGGIVKLKTFNSSVRSIVMSRRHLRNILQRLHYVAGNFVWRTRGRRWENIPSFVEVNWEFLSDFQLKLFNFSMKFISRMEFNFFFIENASLSASCGGVNETIRDGWWMRVDQKLKGATLNCIPSLYLLWTFCRVTFSIYFTELGALLHEWIGRSRSWAFIWRNPIFKLLLSMKQIGFKVSRCNFAKFHIHPRWSTVRRRDIPTMWRSFDINSSAHVALIKVSIVNFCEY